MKSQNTNATEIISKHISEISSTSTQNEIPCKNCQSEQNKHRDTKKALDKSINLNNMLLEEIKKLDH